MLKKKVKAAASKPKHWIREVTLGELREHPETLDLLVNEIVEFAYSDKAKDMASFYRAYRACPMKFHEWRKIFKSLDDALKELQYQVHIYRRELWADRKMAENCFLRYAHLDTYNKLRKQHAQEIGLLQDKLADLQEENLKLHKEILFTQESYEVEKRERREKNASSPERDV